MRSGAKKTRSVVKDDQGRKPVEPSTNGADRAVYPFAGIIGQEEMKLSLLLNAVDPKIGGVVILGHRGTGKSTAVRALADLLPPVSKVRGCPFSCDPASVTDLCFACRSQLKDRGRLPKVRGPVPVVDLPLGTTEDRLCGTLDIEQALVKGVKTFEPGLLARANRGFLYIDEVNLLPDHLVDALLDVAASGRNVVEREGVSVSHPARFVLVGSGNPEEGDLRPQILDRFALDAQVSTIKDIDERVRIVEWRERFERDPLAFRAELEAQTSQLRARIIRAKKRLAGVVISRDLLKQVARLCLGLRVDGHRGELTVARAACALAAYQGRHQVLDADIRKVAPMALRHRLRKDALDVIDFGEQIQQGLDEVFGPAREETKGKRVNG
jgi:magnesium chelatase subunit I